MINLPLREIFDISEWIGIWRKWGSKAPILSQIDPVLDQLIHDGFEVVTQGQPAIVATLDNLIASKKAESMAKALAGKRLAHVRPETLGGIFGKVFHRLHNAKSKVRREHRWFFTTLAERACLAQVLPPEVSLFRHPPVLTSFRTVSQIAEAHGVAANHLRKLLSELGLISEQQKAFSNECLWIDHVHHADLIGDLASSHNVVEAARHLGVDVEAIAYFDLEGHLEPLVSRQSTDGKRLARYSLQALDGLRDRILQTAAYIPHGYSAGEYAGITHTASLVGRSSSEVLNLLVSGRLERSILTDDGVGLGRLRLNLTEVRDNVRLRHDDQFLSAVEAGRLLHVDSLRMRNMIKDGNIVGGTALNPVNLRPQTVVSVQALKAFAHEYVSCKALAAHADVHHLTVGHELRKANIPDVFLPAARYSRFIRRRDLAGTKFAHLTTCGLGWAEG